ncbi:helix-turn-helix domain-containing protein [Flagellimonas pacifica]|uniref:helix-turn-helix domain-containing protein n=1 Tax=Flagellimonas pacifica TaxID=1247520 RepID=UPI001A9C75C3|nr:helix-turn-helix domain-containing protein [Allomuricauda parva]
MATNKLIRKNLIHFVPFLLYLVFISIPVLVSAIKGNFIFEYLRWLSNHTYLMVIFRGLLLVGYILYCLHLFKQYVALIKTNYSSLTNYDFLWIRRLLFGSLIIISLDIFSELYEMVFGYLGWDAGYITVISMVILIAYLGYHGANQSKILLPSFLLLDNGNLSGDVKRQKVIMASTFSNEEIQLLEEKLQYILKEEKPYLDEDLTLNKLAKLLEVTDKKLSAFLNQYLQTTFYDLINKERVAVVKEKLQSSNFNKFTLLGIAYESGFKSKTSFNRIFKKETGLSPSEYRKQYM